MDVLLHLSGIISALSFWVYFPELNDKSRTLDLIPILKDPGEFPMPDTKHHGIDLKHLDKAQLNQLQKDVMKHIREFDDKVRQEAKAKLEKAAAEMGFTLSELTGTKTTKRVHPAKYAYPENPALTWSGRGRQPAWIKERLEAGKSLDELLIKK